MRSFTFVFRLPHDASDSLRAEVEDAEDTRPTPLTEIEAACRRLGVGAKLYGSAGYAGWVEPDGNWVLE